MKLIIVGGVAGGASAAARARRLSEEAEIIVIERGPDVSFANCGLPYHIGEVIPDRDKLLVTSAERLRERFKLDVRVSSEVTAIDREKRTVRIHELTSVNEACWRRGFCCKRALTCRTLAAVIRPTCCITRTCSPNRSDNLPRDEATVARRLSVRPPCGSNAAQQMRGKAAPIGSSRACSLPNPRWITTGEKPRARTEPMRRAD